MDHHPLLGRISDFGQAKQTQIRECMTCLYAAKYLERIGKKFSTNECMNTKKAESTS